MKTTLELPDALVKQIKLRAIRDGRKLKDAFADLLRRGLAADDETTTMKPKIIYDKKRGWPIIVTKRAKSVDEEATPDRLFEIQQAQEAEWNEDSAR